MNIAYECLTQQRNRSLLPVNEKETIQQIVEEASNAAGKGEQFLPIVVIIEVVAALATIWGECFRKDTAKRMVLRAYDTPWSIAGSKVRSEIRNAIPPEYRSPELVDHVVRIAAEKLRKGEITVD